MVFAKDRSEQKSPNFCPDEPGDALLLPRPLAGDVSILLRIGLWLLSKLPERSPRIVYSDTEDDCISPAIIRQKRKHLKLTQEEFASALGVGVATIRRWESGAVKPTGNNQASLARFLASSNERTSEGMEQGLPVSLEEGVRMLMSGDEFKKIIHPGVSSGGSSGMEPNPHTLQHLVEMFQHPAALPREETALPFPRTPVERNRSKQGEVKGAVDAVLAQMFNEEREARGLTRSKMLETILWNYFGNPRLSFQEPLANESPGDPAPADETEVNQKTSCGFSEPLGPA